MTRSKSGNGPPVSLLTKKSKSKKKSTKKQTKKPKQQSGGSDVEDELTDASSLALTDDEADGTETRGHSDSTDADDDELEALAATVASATAEQAKQKTAAADARRRMKLLLDKSHRGASPITAVVTAAAAKRRRADDSEASVQRGARRDEFMRVAGLIPSSAASPPFRPTTRVRFADTEPHPPLSRKAQPDPEDSSDTEACELLEVQPRSSAFKKLASLVQYITGCTLTRIPRRLPILSDSTVTYVYTAALTRAESLMRDRRTAQGSGFTFHDLILVLERLQEFVAPLFARNTADARDAMFQLVDWTRDLKTQVDAAVESCGSADLVNSKFGPFMDTILSFDPAVFNPAKSARETFATLNEQVANKRCKAILSAIAATPHPASAASHQHPSGKGTGGGGKGGGKNGGKGIAGGKGNGAGKGSQPIVGPGPPGSFWHWGRNMFVRFFTDPTTNRQDHRVCFLCGCGSTPGSIAHRADACQYANAPSAPAVLDWVERAIASK